MHSSLLRHFLSLVILALVFVANPVSAQTNSDGSPVAESQPAPQSDSVLPNWGRTLDVTEQALEREGITSDDLERLLIEVIKIREEASTAVQDLQGEVNLARQQLEELGPAPKEGEPEETPEAKAQRDRLNADFAVVDGRLKEARLALVRASQIQRNISNEIHNRFFGAISERSNGLVEFSFWRKFLSGFEGYFKSFRLLMQDSFSVLVRNLMAEAWKPFVLVFFLLLTSVVFLRTRRFFTEAIAHEVEEHGVTAENKSVIAFYRFCRNGILIGLLPYIVYRTFSGLGLLTSRLDTLLQESVFALGFVIAALSLAKVFLSPKETQYRIFELNDGPANRIYTNLLFSLSLAVFLIVQNRTSVTLVSPLEVSVGLSLLFCLAISGTFLASLWIARRDLRSRLAVQGNLALPRFWRFFNFVLWILTLAILASALLGYVAFGEFLSQQLLFGSVVVLSALLLLRFVDYVFSRLAETLAGPADLSATPETEGKRSNQLVILGSGLIKLFIYSFTGLLLLLPWGYRTSDIYQIFESLFFGVEVGGISISISTVMIAIALFIIGYTITVSLRGWLNNKFLPTTSLDVGVSNSISTVFGYAGFILAAIFAVSAAGFDLSNLAIVAGALSVGVGFGLQSIVNNFVSGLILLAERPIKAGDWIVTSGGEGTVRKISVRSTEIETFDRATVIVPNSTLITDNVTNWTHQNKLGRVIVPIGVSYDSDPEQVKEILLECAKAHRLVLGRPGPQVFFMDFGASSLDFQLRVFLSDINYSLTVQSELRFEILKSFREANIEIPFPQNDIHIRSDATKPVVKKPATRKRTTARKTSATKA